MNSSINDIAVHIDESAKTVSVVAENAAELVLYSAEIQYAMDDTKAISEDMYSNIKCFKNLWQEAKVLLLSEYTSFELKRSSSFAIVLWQFLDSPM